MPQNRLSIMPDIISGLSVIISLTGLIYHDLLSNYMFIQLLLLNGILDILDGKLARMFKSKEMQKTGKIVDSVADSINFGLFPAIIISLKSNSVLLGILYFTSIIFRLIRFNRSNTPSRALTYKGLPSPFGSIIAMSGMLIGRKFLMYTTVIAIVLIISNTPTIVFHRLKPKNPLVFNIIAIILISLAFVSKYFLFTYIIIYCLHIPFASLIAKYILPKIANE